ncbi:MAG TPA: flagellar basal-body rod protein FlgF [Burkholderiales bacterium]|jgi:flagellar basal-body rod protein FlgF|nr:flagellar basal-body rod protein FlgF [Burkholderiales bacterium]
MDRMVYVAASGAKSMMSRQDVMANNLANVSTPGFRAEKVAFRVAPVQGSALPTRAFVADSTTGPDLTPGTITTTGNPLDVAVLGKGWLSVQATDGSEAYTRNGGFQLDDQGVLKTVSGQTVLGDGGPITVPPGNKVTIAADGTVSAVPLTGASTPISVGRLKLVNPAESDIIRGNDGLFRTKGGGPADVDPAVRVASGSIEGSNVNAIEAMTGMISLARQFEMQTKLMQIAESNSRKGAEILTAGAA